MKHSKIVKFLFLAMVVSALALSSCRELLTNEKDSSSISISVDLNDIKQQLNESESRSSQSITGSGGAKALVIGAIVVTRNTPYTSGEVLTQAQEDALVEDLANSINYITLVNLPVSKDYIEFLIPPDTAGHWQVVVVAVNFAVDNLGDLADYESKGEITHTGFTPNFYTSGNVGSGVIPITMQLYTEQ